MNLSTLFLKAFSNILFFFICCFLVSCKESQLPFNTTNEVEAPQPKQGVKGKVIYKEGTFDSMGNLISNGTVMEAQRKVYFYELSGLREVETLDGSFLSMVHSTVIDSAKSDKNGNFLAPLKPGMYSVFIQENDRMYSQLSDDGLYYPVTVYKDSVSYINLIIDYKANYIE